MYIIYDCSFPHKIRTLRKPIKILKLCFLKSQEMMLHEGAVKELYETWYGGKEDTLIDDIQMDTISKTFFSVCDVPLSAILDAYQPAASPSYVDFLTSLLMGYLKYRSSDELDECVNKALLPLLKDSEYQTLHERLVLVHIKYLFTHHQQHQESADWIKRIIEYTAEALKEESPAINIYLLTQLILDLNLATDIFLTTCREVCESIQYTTVNRKTIISSVLLGLLKYKVDLTDLGMKALETTQMDLICLLFPLHIDSENSLLNRALISGLNHDDPAIRKQAVHLIKQCNWNEEFITVYDLLDVHREQHLIEQVWPTLLKLIEKSFLGSPASNKHYEFSALHGLLKRQLEPESATMKRDTIVSILTTCTKVVQESTTGALPFDFIYTILLPILNDSSLYKPQYVEVKDAVQTFFRTCLIFQAKTTSEAIDQYFQALDEIIFSNGSMSFHAVIVLLEIFDESFVSALKNKCTLPAKLVDRLRVLIDVHVLTGPIYFREQVIKRLLFVMTSFGIVSDLGLDRIANLLETVPLQWVKESKRSLQDWLQLKSPLPRDTRSIFYFFIDDYQFDPEHPLELIDSIQATSHEIFNHAFPHDLNSENLITALSICARCVRDSIQTHARDQMIEVLHNVLRDMTDPLLIVKAVSVIAVNGNFTDADIPVNQVLTKLMELGLPQSQEVQEFTMHKWAALSHFVCTEPEYCVDRVHAYAVDALETAGSRPEVVISIYQTLYHTLPFVQGDLELRRLWMAYLDAHKTLDLADEMTRCVFQPNLMNRSEELKWLFNEIWHFAEPKRPNIVYLLVTRLCACWELYPSTALPFIDEITEILLYREPILDKLEGVPMITPKDKLARLVVLSFLQSLPFEYHELTDALIVKLLLLNETIEWNVRFMIGGKIFGHKLRCWQALCVLAKFVSPKIIDQTNEIAWKWLQISTCLEIRYFIEMFTIRILMRFPQSEHVLDALRNYRQPAQVSASLLLVVGYVTKVTTLPQEKEILQAIEPWISASHGHVRAIAQYMIFQLRHKFVNINQNRLTFLQQNKECSRMIRLQGVQFESLKPFITVETLLQMEKDASDEIIPPYIHNQIKATATELNIQLSNEKITMERAELPVLEKHESSSSSVMNVQRKITPWDTIELEIEEFARSKRENVVGRVRQEVIMCASLVDKIPNLAGLARTCEIFNAQKLIVPSMTFVQNKLFDQISVTANKWMPMAAVEEERLISYLLECKQNGYTILGLEQTANSTCLSEFQFPSKVVLVLGKEKQGIPVELLQVIDQCIEIPQMGLIRSLNVHVSGAIMMWEYTKQHLVNKS